MLWVLFSLSAQNNLVYQSLLGERGKEREREREREREGGKVNYFTNSVGVVTSVLLLVSPVESLINSLPTWWYDGATVLLSPYEITLLDANRVAWVQAQVKGQDISVLLYNYTEREHNYGMCVRLVFTLVVSMIWLALYMYSFMTWVYKHWSPIICTLLCCCTLPLAVRIHIASCIPLFCTWVCGVYACACVCVCVYQY